MSETPQDALAALKRRQPSDPSAGPAWMTSLQRCPFPLDALPPTVRRMVDAIAVDTCTDPAMAATFVLPVLGAAIGARRSLLIKGRWKEQANLWTAVIASVGAAKSPTLKPLIAPLLAITFELTDEYNRELAAHNAKSADEKKQAVKPVRRSLLQGNPTMEGLRAALCDSPEGVLIARAELAGLVQGLGQYKSGAGDDRRRLLELWSGEWYDDARATDKDYRPTPRSPFTAITGGIQPDVLAKIVDGQGDGLTERFLFTVTEDRPLDARSPGVPDEVANRYDELIRRIWSQTNWEEDDDGKNRARLVAMTPDAREAVFDVLQRFADERQKLGLPVEAAAYWSKLSGHFCRLLVILARSWAVDTHSAELVDVDTVARAKALIDYYRGQALTVLGGGVAAGPSCQPLDRLPSEAAVLKLAQYVHRVDKVEWREVPAKVKAMRGLTIAGRLEALKQAHEAGFVKVEAGPQGGQVLKRGTVDPNRLRHA
jgi:hypothetical protein